ncbi:MAG: threonine synthase [Elusimicrobiales bacterium]
MKKAPGFTCIRCGRQYKPGQAEYNCLSCGGNLDVSYDYNLIKKRLTRKTLEANTDRSMLRYLDILPVEDEKLFPPPQVGWTPLYSADKLASALGISALYIKDEGRNPTCSLKDRASAVAAACAREVKAETITAASTGNAAASLACMTASLDMKTVIFVPRTAPAPKVAQILVFGAAVVMVDGSYDDAFDLCVRASREYGWHNRNTGYNPFTREGKKTCAFEICEQMGWKIPDKVFVSAGDGNIISGLWKGVSDFKKLGIIDKLPQLVAVQAEHSNAIKLAFESKDGEIRPVSGKTVADSISVSLPRDGMAAVTALKESGGLAITVTDEQILAAIPELARGAGVFAEPAGAAAYAGVKKAAAQGLVKKGETAVAVITGNGLKDIESAMKTAGKPLRVKPDFEDFKKLAAQAGL